jgi:hypothetical protein
MRDDANKIRREVGVAIDGAECPDLMGEVSALLLLLSSLISGAP